MNRKFFTFGAIAFFVIALDLLDQGKAAGFTFWSVLGFVCAVTGFYLDKKSK